MKHVMMVDAWLVNRIWKCDLKNTIQKSTLTVGKQIESIGMGAFWNTDFSHTVLDKPAVGGGDVMTHMSMLSRGTAQVLWNF